MATKLAVKPQREKNMSNKGQLLQDPFLNTLRNSVTQMVYKHAISTVVPSRPISLGPDKEPE